MILHIPPICQPQLSIPTEDFSVAQFIRFLKHIKIKKLLSNITDNRQLNKIKYSNDVILNWALSVYFFRHGSQNGLQTALEKLKPHQRTAILNYPGLEDYSYLLKAVQIRLAADASYEALMMPAEDYLF
jgi:hypothetical protein